MPVSKNAYKRYLIIHNFLNKSLQVPKSKERILEILEDEGFKISPSMIEKDLYAMRNTFELPIKYKHEYDADYGGYYYPERNVSFDIPMDDDVVKTIYGALNQLALFENTTAFRNAKESLQKIMTRLDIDLKLKGPGMEDIIFYETQTNFSGIRWIAPVYNAIVEGRSITFTFSQFNNQMDHVVDPYALKEISGRWYVIGSEDDKDAVYGLDRITNLEISDHYFTRNESFRNNLHGRIRFSVGQLDFKKRHHGVHLLYDNSVADEILQNKINETQKVLDRDENTILISVDAILNEEFVRKAILSYGDKVEVTGPPFVIDMVLKILKNIIHKYDRYVEETGKFRTNPNADKQ
jgi:predicted DNA-binding transcriptional regulator YafY